MNIEIVTGELWVLWGMASTKWIGNYLFKCIINHIEDFFRFIEDFKDKLLMRSKKAKNIENKRQIWNKWTHKGNDIIIIYYSTHL